MADLREAWSETGDKLTELGRKLKTHYEQQHGGDGQESRQDLADAAKRVGVAVQDAFEAIGAAAKDKSVQSDVRQVGQSLVEALGATLGQASDELRRVLSERKGPSVPPGAGATVTPVEPLTLVEPAQPAAAAAEPEAAAPEAAASDGAGADGEQPPKVEPWGTP
jgi:hypothetical protein